MRLYTMKKNYIKRVVRAQSVRHFRILLMRLEFFLFFSEKKRKLDF